MWNCAAAPQCRRYVYASSLSRKMFLHMLKHISAYSGGQKASPIPSHICIQTYLQTCPCTCSYWHVRKYSYTCIYTCQFLLRVQDRRHVRGIPPFYGFHVHENVYTHMSMSIHTASGRQNTRARSQAVWPLLSLARLLTDLCIEPCTDMSVDMCLDMWKRLLQVNAYRRVHLHPTIYMCIDMCTNMRIDMCRDTCHSYSMWTGICVGRCIDSPNWVSNFI